MLTIIESKAFELAIVFTIFATLVAIYNIAFELLFRQRRKISYKTYSFFRKMFMLNINAYNIVAISLVLIMSIILFGLFIASPVVRFYLFAIIPVDFMMGVFLYFDLTRPNYNNPNILDFDNYYRNLRKVEASKNRLFEQIDDIQNQYDTETKELIRNLQKYNLVFPNEEKFREIGELVAKSMNEFEQNKNDLINYNTAIIGQFNDSISEYVIQGLDPTFDIQEFHQIDIKQMKQFVVDIKKEIEDYVKETTMTNLINKTPNNSKQIIAALEASEYFNFRLTLQDVVSILRVANTFVDDKQTIATYLIERKYVNVDDLFSYIIEKDWAWCVTNDTISVLTKKQLIHLYSQIIEHNSSKICNVVLKCSAIDQTDVLDKVLATATINNNCVQMIKFHKIIINSAQEFDDVINMYENMTYAILQHTQSKPSNPLTTVAKSIIATGDFYNRRSEIKMEYYKIFDNLHNKYRYLPDVLMCFYDGDLSKYKNIDMTNVMAFYMENMKTLNEEGLRYLNILLSAVILMFDSNQDNIKVAINSVQEDKFSSELDILNIYKAKINGKSLIRFLTTKKLDKIVPIINRIERYRKSLDDVIAL